MGRYDNCEYDSTSFMTRSEHIEFAKRIEAEDDRQNGRLKKLEEQTQEIIDLTISVKELASSVRDMATLQAKHSEAIEALQNSKKEGYEKVFWIIITACVGAVIGYFIGLL